MIDPETLWLFLPVALALNLTPGSDMMLCLALGLRRGPRAGMLGSAGVALGGMIHATVAGLGLAALLAAVPALFEVIRWGGVAYLSYLAWRAWTAPPVHEATTGRGGSPFCQGALVNLTNPKVALFVLALIPQFVDPGQGSVLAQFLILGGILAFGGLVFNGLVGMFAGGIGATLARSPRAGRALNRFSALIFTGLAARLAMQKA